MGLRICCLLAAVTTAFAAAPNFPHDGPEDSPRQFHARCVGEIFGIPVSGPCMSQDMAANGYNNRFRLVLSYSKGLEPYPRFADYVKCSAESSGYMTISSPLLGSIAVYPSDGSIRAGIAGNKGQYEVRPQNVTLNKLPGGGLEILIDEPQADFNGRLPSRDWIERNIDAFSKMSHAK